MSAYKEIVDKFGGLKDPEDRLICAIMEQLNPLVLDNHLESAVLRSETPDDAFSAFHKELRQSWVFGDADKDMFLWHLISYSAKFNKALFEVVTKMCKEIEEKNSNGI